MQVRQHALELIGHGVDAVQRVEGRPHRPADRDVVTVRFPVQVIAEGPEEVIEIGYVITQFGDVDGHVVGLAHHAVRRRAHLFHQHDHPVHRVDGLLHVVGLHLHQGHHSLHVRAVHFLERAAHRKLSRNRAELQGLTFRAGDRLHPSDAGHLGHGLGDPLDHQEVRRIAKVVISFDEQHFGVHPWRRGNVARPLRIPHSPECRPAGTSCRCSSARSPARSVGQPRLERSS